MMRKLSDSFVHNLQSGFLSKITDKVRHDHDLDMQIRDNYINVYFKGNSLLKLDELSPGKYRVCIHPNFRNGLEIPDHIDDEMIARLFLKLIPAIKENILLFGRSSIEIEYEQMIVRANNYEPRNNSEYFIIDRQYTASKAGRFDLTGIYWPREGRRKGQEVQLCLMEIKFALNPEIQNIHEQISRYYQAIIDRAALLAEESEIILIQKLELGLFNQPTNRLEAMKTLTISRKIGDFQFILIFIDYNPYSRLMELDLLSRVSFASQVKLFHSGFAMWAPRLHRPKDFSQIK